MNDSSDLISFQLDFSCIQSKLTQTILSMQNQINELSNKTDTLQIKIGISLDGINDKLAVVEDKIEQNDGSLNQKIRELYKGGPQNLNLQGNSLVVEKTPTQILDDMEKRVKTPVDSSQPKKLSINYSSPNNEANRERIQYSVKVKEEKQEEDNLKEVQKSSSKNIDKKCVSIYSQIMEKVEKQITQARTEFKKQISEWKNENGRLLKKLSESEKELGDENRKLGGSNNQEEKGQVRLDQEMKDGKQINDQRYGSKKQISNTQKKLKSSKTVRDQEEQRANNEDSQESFQKFQSLLRNSQNQLKLRIQQLKDKLEEVTKSNGVTVDHVVQCKKDIKELSNQTDSMRLQFNGLNERNFTADRQLSLLTESSNEHKNKFRELQNVLIKFTQGDDNRNESLQGNQDSVNEGKNKNNDIFRDSRSSFRSSVTAGLGPLRPSNIIKQNNNRIENIEDNMKKLSQKLSTFVERVNRMEDEKKKFGQFQSSLLPKVDKQNKSNVNHFEIIRKDIKKINEDLGKTNEKLSNTKQKLGQLYSAHAQIPMKINDLYEKLRQYNEIQEDRLIELIKQLINRMLIDPFDNNFTNTLKRQINVKFLEIKHEYNSILKEIGNKLDGRAEQTEVLKIKQHFEENIIQVKTLVNKKCETEDFKKGVKYLEGKIKDVFQFTKSETTNLQNEQKKYIGVRKQ